MDLRSLTATIEAQAGLPAEEAHMLRAELAGAWPAAPFAGTIPAGSFHLTLAAAFGTPTAQAAVSSVKLPFTVVFQPSFKPGR